jgi:Ca2+-binding RTX toxin-like protein
VRGLAAIVAVLALLAVPAAALGAEARVEQQGSATVLVFDGGLAKQDATIVAVAGAYRVHDANGINPGPGCANFDADTVTCADTGFDRIEADLGAAADALVVAAAVTLPVIADGGNGEDSLIGGNGDDELGGGLDDDSVSGGGGEDELQGGDDDDIVSGDGGDDLVYGFVAGFDPTIAINEDDELSGGAGNDTIDPDGGGGEDVVAGEAGNDTIHAGPELTSVSGGTGIDEVIAAADPDDGAGSTISLDGVADDGVPGQNANFAADIENLSGSSGDDTFVSPAGVANRLLGGPGFDAVDYGARTADLVVDTSTPGGDGEAGEGDTVEVEAIVGGSGDDRLRDPGATARELSGGTGDDLFEGGSAGDAMHGGNGIDTVTYAGRTSGVEVFLDSPIPQGEDDLSGVESAIGGEGDDLIEDAGQGRPNEISGGPGDDEIFAGGDSDVVAGGPGTDLLDGGEDPFEGVDTVDYADFSVAVTVPRLDLGAVPAGPAGEEDLITGFENATGGAGDDTLRGGAGPNSIEGGAGADTIDGGPGEDVLAGGPDPDSIDSLDGVVDQVSCGSGPDAALTADPIDLVDPDCDDLPGGGDPGGGAPGGGAPGAPGGGASAKASPPGAGVPRAARCAGRVATIVGTPGRNRLTGTRGRDVIAGLGGNDAIRALGGNDIVCGGGGRDVIRGGPGRDRLRGGGGRDRLLGGGGRDTLVGGPGRDALLGGPGRDRQRR